MAKTIDIQKLDQRTVARYIERGLISQQDYDKYLQSLPDLSNALETVNLEQPDKADEN